MFYWTILVPYTGFRMNFFYFLYKICMFHCKKYFFVINQTNIVDATKDLKEIDDITSILDNLRHLAEKEIELIIRIPLIPGVNDDMENLDRTGSFLKQLPGPIKVHILPYHDFQKSKFARFKMQDGSGNITRPTQDMILKTKKRLENFDLEVAIGG